jgi:hypothetical protein
MKVHRIFKAEIISEFFHASDIITKFNLNP